MFMALVIITISVIYIIYVLKKIKILTLKIKLENYWNTKHFHIQSYIIFTCSLPWFTPN